MAADTLTAPSSSITEPRPGSLNRWALRLVPPIGYLVSALILYSRFLAHPTAGVPGGPDGLLYCWYFGWTEHALATGQNPLATDFLNAPVGLNAMWNTGMFGLTVLFAPITALFGPIVAGGLAMTLSPVASATTCYLVLRRLTGMGWRCAGIAMLYGFGPFFNAQGGHLHLIFAVFPPLILLLGHRLLVSQPGSPARTGIWLGVVVGLQLLVGEEVLVLTTVVAVIAVAALAVVFRNQVKARLRYAVIGTGAGALVALVIAGIPLGFQFFGPHALGNGVVASGQRAGLGSLVVPGRFERFASKADVNYSQTRMPANGIENTGYLGWVLIAVILASCIWLAARRDRFVWWWIMTAGITLLLSLGSPMEIDTQHRSRFGGLWAAVSKVPLLHGVVVVRFTLITTLLVALLLAWTLAQLKPGRQAVFGVVLVVLAFIPLLPGRRYGQIQNISTPKFFSTSAVKQLEPASVVLALPLTARPDAGSRVMMWQLQAHFRFKVVGGWGVFERDGKMHYDAELPSFLSVLNYVGNTGRTASASQLTGVRQSVATSKIRYILITEQQHHAAMVADAAAALTGCSLKRVADVTVCEIPVRLPG